MKRKRNHKLLVLVIVPVTAFVLLWIMGKKPEDASVLSAKVVKKSFSVLVEAVGELDAQRSTVIFSQIRGDRGTIVFIVSDG
ncbi:MAG TPA: hypothetical protein VLM43_05515, partial [Desulfobacterales bacterium]|nr:hypothetical protein [Desulfobacterales bacterium]